MVEGATLASVDPPHIEYVLKMKPKFYSVGENSPYPHVSKAQLEAILYACQAFTKKFKDDQGTELTYGFYLGRTLVFLLLIYMRFMYVYLSDAFFVNILGDGTGVGKSRTLAAISYECMLRRKGTNATNGTKGTSKTVWMTASKKLFKKMEIEIKNFDDRIQVLTIEDLRGRNKPEPASKQVLLVTYNIFNNKKYIKTFTKFIGQDFDGCVSCSFLKHLTICCATFKD